MFNWINNQMTANPFALCLFGTLKNCLSRSSFVNICSTGILILMAFLCADSAFSAENPQHDISKKRCNEIILPIADKARNGDLESLFKLGYEGQYGICLGRENLDAAVEYYYLAAEGGHTRAKYYLGYMYLHHATPPRSIEAIALMKESLANGFLYSAIELGTIYGKGDFAPRDLSIAERYWKMAADKYPTARLNLAKLYATKDAEQYNLVEARVLLKEAASKDANASCQLCLSLSEPDQFEFPKDYLNAIPWCKRASDGGKSECTSELGVIYIKGGYGIESNHSLGLEYLRKAANQGDRLAAYLVGRIYFEGAYGTAKDLGAAKKYLGLSAKMGHGEAIRFLNSISIGDDGGNENH